MAGTAIHSAARVRRRPARGFTMIELIVVMILVSVLSAVVMSRIDIDTFRQRGFHDTLKAGLQFARKSAIAKRRQVCVALAGTGTAGAGVVSFTVATAAPEGGAVACPTATSLNLPSRDSNCSVGNAVCTPSGVAVNGPDFYFDAIGKPSAGATFSSTGQSDITVEQETGYVH